MVNRNPEPQVVHQKAYEARKATEPTVEAYTRLGWLTLKKHFGPISLAEIEEIARLLRKKDKEDA